VASHTHGHDVFFYPKTALASSDEVGIGHCLMVATDDASVFVSFPYNVLDLLGYVTGFGSFAFHLPQSPNKLSNSSDDFVSIPSALQSWTMLSISLLMVETS
jgi:hypothetical protein